jgi:hypothetical protein
MTVRNVCRERLSHDELSAYGLRGEWDDYYLAALAAIGGFARLVASRCQ